MPGATGKPGGTTCGKTPMPWRPWCRRKRIAAYHLEWNGCDAAVVEGLIDTETRLIPPGPGDHTASEAPGEEGAASRVNLERKHEPSRGIPLPCKDGPGVLPERSSAFGALAPDTLA